MRTQRIRALRKLVARNFSLITLCCGNDDFLRTCEECNIKFNVMTWALQRLADRFKEEEWNRDFKWIYFNMAKDESLCMTLKSQNTQEEVEVWIPAGTVKRESLAVKKLINRPSHQMNTLDLDLWKYYPTVQGSQTAGFAVKILTDLWLRDVRIVGFAIANEGCNVTAKSSDNPRDDFSYRQPDDSLILLQLSMDTFKQIALLKRPGWYSTYSFLPLVF